MAIVFVVLDVIDTCKTCLFGNEFFIACVVVEGILTFKTKHFVNRPFVYFCVVSYDMYTCKTGNFGNELLFLCLLCCRGLVHMEDWGFWNKFIFNCFVF